MADLASTAGQIAGNIYINEQNKLLTAQQNLADREFQRQINMQNRAWTIEDRDWAVNYNHPKQQMARFKEAGLNPNLIYGKMTEMAPVRTPQAQATQGRTPELKNPMENVALAEAYYAPKIMQQNLENLILDGKSKALDNENKMINNKRNAYDWFIDTAVAFDPLKAGARAIGRYGNYQKQHTESALAEVKYNLAQATKEAKTQQEYEKVIEMHYKNSTNETERAYLQQKLELLRDQHQMNQFEIMLNAMGVNKTDPAFIKIWALLVDQMMR